MPSDTSIEAVLRELNTHALRAARVGAPLSAVGYLMAFALTGHLVYAAVAAVTTAIGLVSHLRLRRRVYDAELVLLAAGASIVALAPVSSPLVRGLISGGVVILAMLAVLILGRLGQIRVVILFGTLLLGQLTWPLFGLTDFPTALTHTVLSLAVLAMGLVGPFLARSALERSEAQRQDVFRRVPMGLLRVDRNGELLEMNPTFVKMLGYGADELIGRQVAVLYEDSAPLMRLASRLGVERGPIRYAHQLRRKDGSTIWVRGYVQPVRDPTGMLQYFEGALEDVTQRREAEEKSRINAERFRNVFERAPIAIWEEDWSGVVAMLDELKASGVTDVAEHLYAHHDVFFEIIDQVRHIDVNPAGIALVGASSKEEAFANTRSPAPPSPIADSYISQFTSIWNGVDHMTRETNGKTVTGEPMTLTMSWAAARDAEGSLDLSHVIVAMADVTTLKRAERDLAGLVASKDELVASVSHELRTPITTIMGMAFELRDHGSAFTADEVQELIELIADQSRELSNIVEDLLVAARSDAETLVIRPEVLPIKQEIEQIVASTTQKIAPAIDAPDDARAWADPLRFRQILRNLLSNAKRYGGPTVRISAVVDGRAALVSVFDDGPGVPAGDEDIIFEPYTRSTRDEALPGSIGLGLPVSRRLARLMGGDLVYRYDGGSVFEVRLPAVDRAAAPV
jgi:PAS domain S-box-containing protein